MFRDIVFGLQCSEIENYSQIEGFVEMWKRIRIGIDWIYLLVGAIFTYSVCVSRDRSNGNFNFKLQYETQ